MEQATATATLLEKLLSLQNAVKADKERLEESCQELKDQARSIFERIVDSINDRSERELRVLETTEETIGAKVDELIDRLKAMADEPAAADGAAMEEDDVEPATTYTVVFEDGPCELTGAQLEHFPLLRRAVAAHGRLTDEVFVFHTRRFVPTILSVLNGTIETLHPTLLGQLADEMEFFQMPWRLLPIFHRLVDLAALNVACRGVTLDGGRVATDARGTLAVMMPVVRVVFRVVSLGTLLRGAGMAVGVMAEPTAFPRFGQEGVFLQMTGLVSDELRGRDVAQAVEWTFRPDDEIDLLIDRERLRVIFSVQSKSGAQSAQLVVDPVRCGQPLFPVVALSHPTQCIELLSIFSN